MVNLTKTELAVCLLFARGLLLPEVARQRGVCKRTIDYHTANIRRKTKTNLILNALLKLQILTVDQRFDQITGVKNVN